MIVKNAENTFSQDDLFYCYSSKLKKFLCKIKGLSYIGKGINDISKNTYWLFLRTDELSQYLQEWDDNAKNGVKAIE